MTGREWKPGDVARLVVQGEEVRGMVTAEDSIVWRIAGHSFFKSVGVGNDVLISDVRPLVAIDPESANSAITPDEAVRQAIETLRNSDYISDSGIADQIEQQWTRKPDEPTGLGAVVEDTREELWVRAGTDPDDAEPWHNEDEGWLGWPDIAVARVLSEGVAL